MGHKKKHKGGLFGDDGFLIILLGAVVLFLCFCGDGFF